MSARLTHEKLKQRVQELEQEILELRTGEQDLRSQSNRYQQALDNLPSAVFLIDRNEKILTWNQTCERIFQYGPEIIGRHFSVLLPEAADISFLRETFKKLDLREKIKRAKLQYKSKTGELHAMSFRIYPLRDLSGELEGAIFTSTGIADRKYSKQVLHQQNLYMSALHETTLGLIKRLDLDDLLKTLIDRAGALVDTNDGFIYLYDVENNDLVIRVGSGFYNKLIGYRIKPNEGLVGKVWQSQNLTVIHDYSSWPGRLADKVKHQVLS